MSRLGPRSQRKASSLAKAAISKQSDEPTKLWAGGSSGSGIGDVVNRPLSIKERQQLDQDSEEKLERERKTRRRKVRRRLDELERTNPRDAISSSRVVGGESSSRNDGESMAVPNTALEAAARRRQERLKSGQKGSNVMADPSSGPLSTTRKQSAAVRRLLTYRRPFYALLEDAVSIELTAEHSNDFRALTMASMFCYVLIRLQIQSSTTRLPTTSQHPQTSRRSQQGTGESPVQTATATPIHSHPSSLDSHTPPSPPFVPCAARLAQ